jgi:hypothetical protein
MGLKSTDFGPFGTITLKLGTSLPLAIAFANSSALSFHSLGICQKTTFAPCRWNCRTAVRKSFHKCWFLMGDDSPCRLIPFHPGFSQLSRHHISHRDTKEHACRFSTCTWAVTQWVCQKHHLLRVHKISKIRLKEARPPGEAGNTGFDPSTAD